MQGRLFLLVFASFAMSTPLLISENINFPISLSYKSPKNPFPIYKPILSYPNSNILPHDGPSSEHVSSHKSSPSYKSVWSVEDPQSGNNYDHQESRKGHNTHGSYSVLLPDGRIQRVTYTVSKDSGFVAKVDYEEAEHPEYRTHETKPSYKHPSSYFSSSSSSSSSSSLNVLPAYSRSQPDPRYYIGPNTSFSTYESVPTTKPAVFYNPFYI